MKLSSHIIISFSVGSALGFFARSAYAGFLCFIAGTLIDVDHIIEYIVHYGFKDFSLKRVFLVCDQTSRQAGEDRFRILYLIFHSYELAIILWIIYFYVKSINFFAFVLGYSLHLFMDSVGNPIHPYFYFITWRAANNFDSNKFFRRTL